MHFSKSQKLLSLVKTMSSMVAPVVHTKSAQKELCNLLMCRI